MSDLRHLRFGRDRGPAAASIGAELLHLYAEVYAEPPYLEGPEHTARFAEHLHGLWTAEGFELVRATTPAGELVGVAYGFTMSTGEWFPHSSPAPPDILGRPHFTTMEWMTRRPWRRQGIGRRLLAGLLSDRLEPWAVVMANPAAVAHGIYLEHGWRRVGTSAPPMFPEMDVLARALPQRDPD